LFFGIGDVIRLHHRRSKRPGQSSVIRHIEQYTQAGKIEMSERRYPVVIEQPGTRRSAYSNWRDAVLNRPMFWRGSPRAGERCILLSFEFEFTGGWRPGRQIETLAGDGQRRAFTPALILFIALPEAKDNTDPG
jgi:hypothetical protein